MRSSVKSRDIREFFGRAQRSQETPATPSEESLGRELDGDSSRQLVPTSRVDQGLIPVLEDGLVDEDEDLDPIRPVSSRRKRVIPDSDDELEESDGETVMTPAIQEKRRKVEEPEADLEDEDIESKVLAVVEASMEDETPESSSDDEVVDEEYIPSPDDVVDDDNLTAEAIQVAPIQAIAGQRRFVQILYNCLLALKTWADGVDLVGVAREKRPMTLGYWRLLKQLSLELIVSMWLAGISEEVQAFFEKDSWCLDDILSLPLIAGDRRQGIYGDFATGDIIRRKDADNACDAYVGLAGVLLKRIGDHQDLARKSVDELPKAHKKSLHYRQICRKGVKANFRKLAAFDKPIHRGYLQLLEGVFCVLLGTYQWPGYESEWAPESSYDMVAKLRGDLGLPSVSWRGMNAAWPLHQGFFNAGVKSASECANPACKTMTYPMNSTPDGVKKRRREHETPGDPLGPYLCMVCYRYRTLHKELPGPRVLGKIAMYAAAREAAGKDAACACCDRNESHFRLHKNDSGRGQEYYRRTFRIHSIFPGRLLCEACWYFVQKNKRLRTPKEVRDLIGISHLLAYREGGGDPECENCQRKESELDVGAKHHHFNTNSGKVLCDACWVYLETFGKMRDPKLNRVLKLRRQLQADRKAGRRITCSKSGCTKVERLDKPNAKKFGVSSVTGTVMCPYHKDVASAEQRQRNR